MRLYKLILLLACSAHAAFSQYMPEGFEDIKIGMSREDLLQIKQNLKDYNPGISPVLNPPLMETFPPDVPIKDASRLITYTFENNKLQAISFLYSSVNDFVILKKYIQAMGPVFKIDYGYMKNTGILKWGWSGGQSLITLPFKFEENKASIAYQVFHLSMIEKIKLSPEDLSKIKRNTEAFEDFKKRITAYAEGVLAEVEAQAEVTDVPLAVVAKAEGKSADQDGEYANTEYSESATQGLGRPAIYTLVTFVILLLIALIWWAKR